MAGFCGNCGTRIEDGMLACPNCGTKVYDPSYGGYSDVNNNALDFISSDEKIKDKIGASYVGSFLRGNGISKNEAICTDKRFYFSGVCYDSRKGALVKMYQEWIVDLEDITASGFKHTSNLFLLFMSVIAILWGFFILIKYSDSNGGSVFAGSLVIAGILFAIWWFTRKTLYVVLFAGGCVAVDTSQYGVADTRRFNKVLRAEKQKKIEVRK